MQFFPQLCQHYDTSSMAVELNGVRQQPLPDPIVALQSQCSSFFNNLVTSLSASPAASQLRVGLQAADRAVRDAVSVAAPRPAPSWAAASPPPQPVAEQRPDLTMNFDEMERRLAGIPVYALSNFAEEFMLVSGTKTGKSLGLLCFNKDDAEALLEQVKCLNPSMRQGSKVVPVALNKVFQLKVNGVAFRFIPDSHQIVNAVKVMEQFGDSTDGFLGVPVFQSRSLVLKSQSKRYRPVFFRKEDLEDSLYRASKQQNYLNPAIRKGEIQVSSLEEIIADMKENSVSRWNDVVFVPPGFDISVHLGQQPKAVTMG